jgi:hypothetical protein
MPHRLLSFDATRRANETPAALTSGRGIQAIEVLPFVPHSDVRLVHSPGGVHPPGPTIPPLLELWDLPNHPAQDGRVGQLDPALGHHGHQIPIAQPVRDVPCTRARIPIFNSGRLGRDFSRHSKRHPARCQRINVSGRTTTKASRQLKHRDSSVNAIRVTTSIRRGLTPPSI